MSTGISSADKKRKPRKNLEDALQTSCINWFKMQHRKLWEAKRLFSIPNAAKRSAAIAATMKRTGMVAGVSDLFLSIPRGQYSGLFIELKVGTNSLSEEQEKFIKAHENDYCCQVCWTLEEFITAVNNYLQA